VKLTNQGLVNKGAKVNLRVSEPQNL